MKKTKIKSTKQFNKSNEVKPAYLGEIDYSVLMYDKESIDNISSNLSIDYTEKNTLLSNEIFTKINLLSSSHNTDFNNLSNLIAKNIDFIKTISVDLSDDISNIVNFNKEISILNTSLDELSNLHKEDIDELSSSLKITNKSISELSNRHSLEIETLEQEISTLNNTFETFENELNNKILELVDADGKIFEDKLPDRIIKIINDLSDATDLNDAPGIINFLSKKIDTDITNLSNEFNSEIFNIKTENFDSIYEIYNVINDLSGNITEDIEKLYNDLSDEIQSVNDAIIDLSDSLSNEVFILNSKIDNLNNEFNSEITEIKAENILSFCEIYNDINDLSGSVTQDIENLYDDLSDEILSINDIIADLSDTLSNEISVLNSKIDELSNNLENSINESINNMIIDEVIENSNSLVKSSGIFKALQKDFVKIELSSDETISLKNNTVYSITTETNEITPTLQFPINGKGSDEILISIRSENSSGVKYDIGASDNRDSLIYTQDGKLTFDYSSDNYATVIKGEFDGLFWYVHDHIYKRVVDNTITIILSGKNNYGKIQTQEQIITITYDKMDSVKIDDYVNSDDWNFLFNNNKCKLLGWTATETFSENNPEYKTDHIFKFTENDFGKVFTLYPIYEIEEVSITRITLGENKKYDCPTSWMEIDGTTINIKQKIIDKGYGVEKQFDGSVNIPFGLGVSARIKGQNDKLYSSASKFGWDNGVYGTAFGENYTTLLSQVDMNEHSTGEIWLHNLTWTNGTQSITLYGKKHNTGAQTATYQLFIDKIKIGFNRYNLFENCLNVPMFPKW